LLSSGPLEDRLAIRELIDSYNDAVMRFDAEAWASNWAEDGIWSLPGMGEVAGRDTIVGMWKQAMAPIEVRGFFAFAGPIVVDGETATGTWYKQEVLRSPTGMVSSIVGEYHDDYVKREGRWWFKRRVYTVRHRSEAQE
jgi:uncharacterized protein (TIGR02246 family)